MLCFRTLSLLDIFSCFFEYFSSCVIFVFVLFFLSFSTLYSTLPRELNICDGYAAACIRASLTIAPTLVLA